MKIASKIDKEARALFKKYSFSTTNQPGYSQAKSFYPEVLVKNFKESKEGETDAVATAKNKSSYRSIIKGTAIFGGAQVFQILITIMRGKIVAILLGPTGSGITALFSSTTNIITQFSGLGLNFSAVRDISQANESGDITRISRVVKVFRSWVWFTGLLGGLICLVFARQFSEFAFSSADYTWGFVWLSIALLLNALATGETSLLQGTRQLKYMAKASVVGSVIGLLTSVPLYYYWKLSGIIPAIIVASLSAFIVNRHFARKIKLEKNSITISETFVEGQQMAKLGIVLMVTQVIGTLATYILNAFISQRGGIVDVGLFQSGILITNHAFGLVFTSMGVDYFPRLSAISTDTTKLREMVNQQCILVILIITPLLIGLIIFAPLLIKILLSSEYLPAMPLVRWISLGMILKAAAYALGYISFAKGDKKTFFWLEGIFSGILTLVLNIIGYTFWGIEGLGISFFVGYIIYIVVLTILVYKKYDFRFNREFFALFILQLALCLLVFSGVKFVDNQWLNYLVGIPLLGGSMWYSWYELDKRIDIKNMVKEKLKKK